MTRQKTYLTREEQVRRTLKIFSDNHREQGAEQYRDELHWYRCAGVSLRNTRSILRGDLLFVNFNSADRLQVECKSSKGHDVAHCFMTPDYDFVYIEFPPHLTNLLPDDADIQLFLVDHTRMIAASGIGASSPQKRRAKEAKMKGVYKRKLHNPTAL